MNISLNQKIDSCWKEYSRHISRIVGSNVLTSKRIRRGRNSRVVVISCENSQKYVIKFYFSHKLDKRDRMGVEFSSLRFLWKNGIRCIPHPIAFERDYQFAIYSYIEGRRISSKDITKVDISYAVDFLKCLDKLKLLAESEYFLPASEACFSVKEIIESIEKRYNLLLGTKNETREYRALHLFLEKEFNDLFNEVVRWCIETLSDAKIHYSFRLPKERQTLSPSDFGFHNALKDDDNKIIFLDFEYFGWDDPAKMISDFLLHPNMNLKKEFKMQFVEDMLAYFSEDSTLKIRLKVVFPLFGLKWSLILLNEFLPEIFLRRNFVYNSKLIKKEVQTHQLLKAKRFLKKIKRNFKNFAYEV